MDKKEKNSLKRLYNVIKKNSSKIAIILFLFTLCGCFYTYQMVTPKYKSVSTIILTRDNKNQTSSGTVTQSDLTLNKSLIATYRKILKSDTVLNQVISNLNLDMTKEELYDAIEVNEEKDTQIIKVEVASWAPEEAQKIATELNNVFTQEIKDLYKMDNVGIVDEASLEEQPYNIHHMADIFMFFGAGVICSMIMIGIIYMLDTTIKIEQDIEEYVGLNIIGSIPMHKMKEDEELIVQSDAKSVIAEAFKAIRTNISFSKINESSKTVLFTSCNASEGKSWIAANMAVAFAWSNKNVIIVDADMRKGRQHNIFGVSNENGLSDCLTTIKNREDYQNLKRYIKQTNVPKVHIMTIGTVPPNPSELLSSSKMGELMHMLKCMYDVVIIDGTPCNLVADSIPVSRIADSTIIVTESRRTKIEDLQNVIKLVRNVGGTIEGAILNKKEVKNKEYGKGYYYGKNSNSNAKVELVSHTVKELIDNRKEYVEEEPEIVEAPQDESITALTEKIEGLEDKLLKIPDMNLESYTKAVEDIRKIYEKEIDKTKLAEEIKENIIQNELVKKLEETNKETKGIFERKMQELDNSKLLSDVLDKIEELQASQAEKFEETNVATRNILTEKIDSLNYGEEIKELISKVESLGTIVNQNANTVNIEGLDNIEEKLNNIENSIAKNNETAEVVSLNDKLEEIRDAIDEKQTQDLMSMIKDLAKKVNVMQEIQDEKLQMIQDGQASRLEKLQKEQNSRLEELQTNQSTKLEELQEQQNDKLEAIETMQINQTRRLQENAIATRAMLEDKIESLKDGEKIDELKELSERLTDIETVVNENAKAKEMQELTQKLNSIENAVNENETDKLMKNIEQQLNQTIEKMKAENDRKLKQIDSKEEIKEIMKELKKINNRYEKLAEKVNQSMTAARKTEKVQETANTKKTNNTKSKVIELEKAKEKLKQEELVIEFGQEIAYEQLLDYAVDIYDIDPKTYVLTKRNAQ